MTPYEYLRGKRVTIPAWLDGFKEGSLFNRRQFFASRTVYYPGSRTDGHPVKLFGSTHSAHCFVYADYDLPQETLEERLAHPNTRFRGYHTLARIRLSEAELVPEGWIPHVHPAEVDTARIVSPPPYGICEILERDEELGDDHGPLRLALLFLGADAIAAFDALYCQSADIPAPFAVVLEDHGFGGNYDRFGSGGLLERIASGCDRIPEWLLVAEGTKPWVGFEPAPDVSGDRGGMGNSLRFLHERSNASLRSQAG